MIANQYAPQSTITIKWPHSRHQRFRRLMGRHNHRCAGRPTALRGEERTRSEQNIRRSPSVNTDERSRRNVLSDKNVNRDARPFLSLRHIGGNIWRAVLGTRGVGVRGRRVRCLPFFDSQEEGSAPTRRQRLAGEIPAKREVVRSILAAVCGIAP